MAWWNPRTWFEGGASGRTPRAWRIVRAKFDSAQTTPDNRRHWANADLLSADAAATPEVRRVLRSRARYEVANNCYARGIILTLANDVISTGPRLQMLLGDGADAGVNQTIEREFAGREDRERSTRITLAKLESSILRRFLKLDEQLAR